MKKSIKNVTLTIAAILTVSTLCFGHDSVEAYALPEDIQIETTDVVETEYVQKRINEIEETIETAQNEVKDPVETGIYLNIENVKTEYTIGETLNLDNLQVTVTFDNGEERILATNEYTVSEIDMNIIGTKEVEISYADYSTIFEINVSFYLEEVEPQVKYASTSLNLRVGPGTEYDTVCSINLNDEVTVIANSTDGWVKVTYQDGEYFCSGNYLMDKKKEVIEKAATTAATTTSVQTDMTAFVFDGNVSQDCQNKAIELYSLVPQNVKNAIASSGFKVVVSSDSSWTNGHAGLFYTKEWSDYYKDDCHGYSISIYAGSVSKVNMAVIHEIGHFIDEYLGIQNNYDYSTNFGFKAISSCEEWQQIYAEEVGASGFPSWTNWCAEEYFAECVWKALADPEWCQKTLPKSYEFVMNAISGC